MSLQLWTAHYYLLSHEYDHHIREIHRCRDENDPGKFLPSYLQLMSFRIFQNSRHSGGVYLTLPIIHSSMQ
jgi:hypothetical protein